MTATDHIAFPPEVHVFTADAPSTAGRAASNIPNVMTRDEFSARWQEHLITYGPTRQTAGAKAEQHLADLFGKSGWTQDEIAAVVGFSRVHVSHLLAFGSFLANVTTVTSADLGSLKRPLTERRFRDFWTQAKEHAGNDRRRFRATWELILAAEQDEAAGGRKTPRDFKPLRDQLGKQFSDGKWHDAKVIADRLDTDIETVADMIGGARKFRLGEFPYEVESKPVGTSIKYRLFRQDRQISLQRVEEELEPIIEGLMIEGKKNPVTASPGTVARLAHQLKKLVEKWAE